MIVNINQIIEIELLPGIEALDGSKLTNNFFSYFTTEMSPMLASIHDVRRLIGAYIAEIPDDVINQLILEMSIEAQDLATCAIDEKWMRYANKWVAFKVALTVLYNSEELRGITSGKEFKQLGDFSISKGGGTANNNGVGKAIDWLECELFKYDFSVRHCRPPALNCLGLTDNSALPYLPKLAGLAEKGSDDLNKPVAGRRWATSPRGIPRGNNKLYYRGRKYGTNIGTNRGV